VVNLAVLGFGRGPFFPGGLLGVVQLGGAAGLFAENVVDVLEGLFKHGLRSEYISGGEKK
jgi:hypothetical protein